MRKQCEIIGRMFLKKKLWHISRFDLEGKFVFLATSGIECKCAESLTKLVEELDE